MNRGFLIIGRKRTPNMASRALALACQNLPEQWKIKYGYAHTIQQISTAEGGSGLLPAKGSERIFAEIDGTMLPVVTTNPGDDNNARKHREHQWKELRLVAAKQPEKVDATYAVSGGTSVEQAGYAWAQAVEKAGWAIDTQIHAVGDDAEWIYQQYK